jgi:hypothetical protein
MDAWVKFLVAIIVGLIVLLCLLSSCIYPDQGAAATQTAQAVTEIYGADQFHIQLTAQAEEAEND